MPHPLLDQVRIASPCSADWDAMRGTDRARVCADCRLTVHNLSAMTADEAEALLADADGRVCARLRRRADGTVLTRDCPTGVRRERRARWGRRGVAAAVAAGAWAGSVRLADDALALLDLGTTMGIVAPPMDDEWVMGDIGPIDDIELMGEIAPPEDGW